VVLIRTVNFIPEDVPKLKRWVVDHADLLGGLSFIQHNPSEVYQQAPFTEVTKTEYEELVEITKDVNFDEVHGDIVENGFENQCSSGRCEIGTEKFASVTDGFIKST
jgi:ribonucleoside-triphosphate reductase (thioredoxin)